ncbi:MAG TPA: hypothetical protein VFI92_05085, partial [Steroidobacteraceae bacterium]|nr:hypothetical protein [Steroidobacteraceae bacterium]
MSTIRRTTRAPSCLLAAALGFASSGAPAQPVPVAVPSEAPSSILLRSRVMDPRGRMPEGIGEGEFGRAHILASFDRAVTRREVLELKKTFDIQVLDSCPVNAYVLSVPQRLLQGEALLRSLPPGTRVAPLQPTDKLSPRLMLRGPRYPPKVPPYTARRGDLVEAIVLFHGDLREEDAQTKLLSQQRARPLQRMSAINGWRIALPEEQIARLAERDSVKWIEEGPPPPHDDNNEVRGVDGVNADAVQAAMGSSTGGGGYGLTGQGVVIAQWETKNASVAHKDLAPRVTLGDTIVPPDSRFYRYADVAADAQYNGGEPFYLDVDDSLTVTPGDWRAANIGTLAVGTVLAGDADVTATPT